MNPRSYKSPTREEAAAKTRARIVAAAARILGSRRDSAGFSLESVAKSAHVTRLTVYNQFGSRRALLEAVFDDRAERGGLNKIAGALSSPNAEEGLQSLIRIFCEFWSSDEAAIARLHAAGPPDAEFAESIRARNERRRHAISALVTRIVGNDAAKDRKVREAIDTLFALTSFQFFISLRESLHSKDEVCAIIQRLTNDTLARVAKNS